MKQLVEYRIAIRTPTEIKTLELDYHLTIKLHKPVKLVPGTYAVDFNGKNDPKFHLIVEGEFVK